MIAAVMANVHRRKGARPFSPQDFLPRARARRRRPGNAAARVQGFFEYLTARAETS